MSAVFRLIPCWFGWFASFDGFPSAMSEIFDLKCTSTTHAIETASNSTRISKFVNIFTSIKHSNHNHNCDYQWIKFDCWLCNSNCSNGVVGVNGCSSDRSYMYNGHEWNQIEIMIHRSEHSTDPKSIWFNVEIKRKKHTKISATEA